MKQQEIAALLPGVIQRTLNGEESILGALLAVMEEQHAPSERVLTELDTYLDAVQAPDEFVPFLAKWVDKDIYLLPDQSFPAGLHRLRALMMASMPLSKIRGTKEALTKFLEIATGLSGFEIREVHERPFHVCIEYPPGARPYRNLIRQIIEIEKPAYVTYELKERIERR